MCTHKLTILPAGPHNALSSKHIGVVTFYHLSRSVGVLDYSPIRQKCCEIINKKSGNRKSIDSANHYDIFENMGALKSVTYT